MSKFKISLQILNNQIYCTLDNYYKSNKFYYVNFDTKIVSLIEPYWNEVRLYNKKTNNGVVFTFSDCTYDKVIHKDSNDSYYVDLYGRKKKHIIDNIPGKTTEETLNILLNLFNFIENNKNKLKLVENEIQV